MHTWKLLLPLVVIVAMAGPVAALEGGTDVFVPAAARAGAWVTDLYVLNPGTVSADLTLYWLVRDHPNTEPQSAEYALPPGGQLVLEDLIAEVFGLDDAGGALRVVSDQQVVVSSRIFNLRDGVTFGQGFEGIPRSRAVGAGGSAHVLGLSHNAGFRTNLILVDTSGSGSSVRLSLRDNDGVELATRVYELRAFEPVLDPVTDLDPVAGFGGTFEYGSLYAEVISGAAIVVASKVDNDPATGDPTTLAAFSGGSGGSDGVYQIVIYESTGFASGGSLEVEDGSVTRIDASYVNLDKGDPADPDCTLAFLWGSPEAGVHTLDEYAGGVSFLSQPYASGGTITWSVQLVISNDQAVSGTVGAVGSGFSGFVAGCNGTFPTLELRGGKSDQN